MSITVQKHPIVPKFFAPILQFIIEQDPLHWYKDRDWEKEGDRFRRPELRYPLYYKQPNFHGIPGGYLSVEAALSYDAISQWMFLPHEKVVRRSLINAVRCQPQRILDLGCGTGCTTLLLKRAFPEAEVIGIDLSPYMLVVAANKAQNAGLDVQFLQGNAEQTEFADRSFDLVTASFLLHETPTAVSKAILQESYRLLRMNGEVVVLDGNQQNLRHMNLNHPLFEEPYLVDYAAGSVDAWMGRVGFERVQTHNLWWIQQVSRGVKLAANGCL